MEKGLASILLAAALMGSMPASERRSSHVPKTQFKRKVWMKRKKRLAIQKQSRKANRKTA